ncbi:RASEF protein, partial [Polypterus senegalus]
MEDEEELDRLRLLFHACDANNSGRIEKEELFLVCSELRVQPYEIEEIFTKLDLDKDGSINFEEFVTAFHTVSEVICPRDMEGDNAAAWGAFRRRLGEEARFIPRPEQVGILYQNINLTEPRLVPQYERVIMGFTREIKLQTTEMENLALTAKRYEELLKGYSDEQDNHARQTEIFQSANRRLQDSNDALRSALENSFSKGNKSLSYLFQRVLNISPVSTISRSSQKFSGRQSPFFDRSSHSSYVDEDCDSLALCDPMRRISCEVESLAESGFDSGLSTLRDSNDCDSESEYRLQRNFQRSQEMQENFGGDASDNDVPEIRDEIAFAYSSEGNGSMLDWKPVNPVSRSSSGASTRKCISAISPQVDKIDGNFKFPSSEKAYKIVLAGDAAVGKSSFLLRLCKNEFRGNTSATLGVDFQMKTLIVDGEPTMLQLWDTAGQERFRSIAKSYFRRADGVLLLYDVTCEKSFINVREWVDMIEDVSLGEIPIMLVGNKADLRKQATEEGLKCVSTSFGEKLAMSYSALFCETSAKDGSNIIEAVLHLAREVRKRCNTNEDKESVTSLSGMSSKKANAKTCCTV